MKTNEIIKLYKEAKKGGKTQVWWLEVEGNKFRSHEGFVDGTISIGSWVTCEGKNIWKANETSPEAQAVLEAAARIQKKKDKGYTEDINSCARPFEPTLAHVLEDYKDKVTFPVLVSSKLDGLRCIFKYKEGKIFSRNNKEIVSCPHIVKEIKALGIDHLELDGELYNHELKNDFNKIISLVRKTKPTQADLDEAENIIQYHVFDYVSDQIYAERYYDIRTSIGSENFHIRFVPHATANSWEEVEKINALNVKQGYEGSMIRWGNEGYHNGRTKHLLKMKTFQDIEAPVVAILEGRGKRADTVGKWVILLENGQTNEVSPTGTDEFNKDIWLNKEKYIGQKITVKYQGRTPENFLRFPTFVAFRDYE